MSIHISGVNGFSRHEVILYPYFNLDELKLWVGYHCVDNFGQVSIHMLRAIVKKLIEKTKTSKGLKVTVQVIDKLYETGRKVADDFKENMQIVFDEYLPQWNYRAVPNGEVI